MKLFTNSLEASFVERPNRFVVTAETENGIVRAHCPNPGRLEELLHPGREIILERTAGEKRKTSYTLVAAHYKGKIIPLYSTKANQIARELIIPGLFPDFIEIIPEYSIGSSRFDFFVRTRDKKFLIEVKACTLVEHGIAMFPDAPSSRARRHLTELAEHRSGDLSGHVLFIIMNEDAQCFVPNLHTDPKFALELERIQRKIGIHAVSVSADTDGSIRIINHNVPIDFSPVELVRENRGVYIVLGQLLGDTVIEPGALGEVLFKKGFYVYVGSALKNLMQRTARHKRKRKKIHWHIDYFLNKASLIKTYPIFSYDPLECSLAFDIKQIAEGEVPNFGSSDCSCSSHFFYFPENPMMRIDFTDILFTYRHVKGMHRSG